jgi:hypothetical protein
VPWVTACMYNVQCTYIYEEGIDHEESICVISFLIDQYDIQARYIKPEPLQVVVRKSSPYKSSKLPLQIFHFIHNKNHHKYVHLRTRGVWAMLHDGNYVFSCRITKTVYLNCSKNISSVLKLVFPYKTNFFYSLLFTFITISYELKFVTL